MDWVNLLSVTPLLSFNLSGLARFSFKCESETVKETICGNEKLKLMMGGPHFVFK